MRRLILILIAATISSCTVFKADSPLVLMSWNVQNLFDAVKNGGEYAEFDPSTARWNEGLFHDRLEKISKIILDSSRPFGPDILVLYEIENKNVVEQLSKSYLSRCGYRYRYLSQNPSGIKIALLTRYKIVSIQSHRIATTDFAAEVNLRDILEFEIATTKGDIRLFANHWKSRLGGEEATEEYRIKAATLLNNRIESIQSSNEERQLPIIVCGDLNESIDQFELGGEKNLCALMPASKNIEISTLKNLNGYIDFELNNAKAAKPLLFVKNREEFKNYGGKKSIFYSPWFESTELLESRGSYFYKDSWETLDHIFINEDFFNAKKLQFYSFEVFKPEEILTATGAPKKWISTSRSGYSDHLPLIMRFK